ncbi:hypothetical protein [Neomegalonema sp.]|uniref:hypothetical protein n=1 Tax=Neomegalonema sp. TaxID=2039713 RepID=UPI0026093E25|nr:hypothetical protein [Neomegalonema sp.]MDD2867092.1 hypothetical protein [Neomegalonema sp.]
MSLRGWSALLVGAMGALWWLGVVAIMERDRIQGFLDFWPVALLGGLGAAPAGALLARGLGGEGPRGWLISGFSLLLATFLGAAFGGLLMFLTIQGMEFFGLFPEAASGNRLMRSMRGEYAVLPLFAPLLIAGVLLEGPPSLLLWLGFAAGVHLLMRERRRRSAALLPGPKPDPG